MGRIKTGLALAKKSAVTLRADKSLVVFPILAFVFIIIAAIIIWTPALILSDDQQQNPAWIAALIIFAYISTTLTVYFNVALTACAVQALQGEQTSVSQGIHAANSRLKAIIGWGFVAATVGLLLRFLEERFQLAGAIASMILGAAWGIASFFAIPVIALEGEGPLHTLKRSASIVRKRWGEGFTGSAAIGVLGVLAFLAILAVFGGGAYLAATADLVSVAVLVGLIGFILLVIISLILNTLTQIFRVAVYQYALDGAAPGIFSEQDLADAFKPSKKSKS